MNIQIDHKATHKTSKAITSAVAGVALASGLTLAPAVVTAPVEVTVAHAASAAEGTVDHGDSIALDKFLAGPGTDLEAQDLGLVVSVSGFEAGDYAVSATKGDLQTPATNFTVDDSGNAQARIALVGDEMSQSVKDTAPGEWNLEVVRVGSGDVSSVSTTTFTVTDSSEGGNETPTDEPSANVTIDHKGTIPITDYMLEVGAGDTIPDGYGLDVTVSGLEPKTPDEYTLQVTNSDQTEGEPDAAIRLLPDEGGNAHETVVARYADNYSDDLLGKRVVQVFNADGEVLASSEFEVVADESSNGNGDDTKDDSTDDATDDSTGDATEAPQGGDSGGGTDDSTEDPQGGSKQNGDNQNNQSSDTAQDASSNGLPRTGMGLAGLGVGAALLATGAIAYIVSRRKA